MWNIHAGTGGIRFEIIISCLDNNLDYVENATDCLIVKQQFRYYRLMQPMSTLKPKNRKHKGIVVDRAEFCNTGHHCINFSKQFDISSTDGNLTNGLIK